MILAGDYVPKRRRVRWELPEGLVLCNLEAPVTGEGEFEPQPKSGPHLQNTSLGGVQPGFAFALANNHMMDYGVGGLKSTFGVLKKNNIPYVGAGLSVEEARKPIILEEAGKKIAVFSCCERQFGVATPHRAGVAEMGEWLFEAVNGIKSKVDYVIVSCHAALESSPFPDPELRRFYKRLIDAGVDIVHGHHAHVPQGWERYNGGFIFYGLGNFVVDPEAWSNCEHHLWALAVDVDFYCEKIKVKPFYTRVESDDVGSIVVRRADEEECERCDQYMELCNNAFESEEACLGYWQEACVRCFDKLYGIPLHIPAIKPVRLNLRNRARYTVDLFQIAFAILTGRKYRSGMTAKRALIHLNAFHCPSHHRAISTAMRVLSGHEKNFITEVISYNYDRINT